MTTAHVPCTGHRAPSTSFQGHSSSKQTSSKAVNSRSSKSCFILKQTTEVHPHLCVRTSALTPLSSISKCTQATGCTEPSTHAHTHTSQRIISTCRIQSPCEELESVGSISAPADCLIHLDRCSWCSSAFGVHSKGSTDNPQDLERPSWFLVAPVNK
jgi:hypothetical protein